MAKRPRREIALNNQVFVNCPFDAAYRPCFVAILFTITMARYQVRCALEEDDAGDVRFDKLCELIGDCDRSIHDQAKRAVIMVAEPYVMPRFLSDLAGNDPRAHHDDPTRIVGIIRDHLHTDPAGQRLPGSAHMCELLAQFRNDLPNLARSARLTVGEVEPFGGYRNFMDLLRGFRDTMQSIAD